MFKEMLYNINSDLSSVQNVNRTELLRELIQNTLDVSHERYCKNLKLNYNYLLSRDNLKVIKTIKREKNKEELPF